MHLKAIFRIDLNMAMHIFIPELSLHVLYAYLSNMDLPQYFVGVGLLVDSQHAAARPPPN